MTRVKELASAILDGQWSIVFTGPHTNKFLASYASGTYVYNTETLAKDACSARTDCKGVTRQPSEIRYTLRTGLVLYDSGSGEISWQKSGGGFTGPHTNKFLGSYASGTNVYTSEIGAKDACTARTDCKGVTQESVYTLRMGLDLMASGTTEVSWQKSTIENSVLDLVGILGNIRKVRVQLERTNYLHMREIQVFDKNGLNVALNKVATQSGTSEYPAGVSHPASDAVNGDVTGFGSFSGYQAGKYFNYQLQQPMYIYRFIQYILTCFLLYIKVHGGRWTWEQM
jgi:hypothetical protein